MCWILTGCAPAATTPAATTAAGAEQPPPASALSGVWVEFWALQGDADTERYALFDDGRFGWRAPAAGASAVVRRWGQWTATPDTLVLSVQGEQKRSDCEGDACTVAHQPALEQRLPLGDCPPNEEARTLDASYRCIGIGGQAFWRRPQPEDPAAYLPP